MRTLKSWVRIAAALALIALGTIVLLFYQQEEFGLVIGVASIVVGLGFLWRSWQEEG
jgi:UDP-N-acetylmuramyl pentapeptide phosphotransferase/UDP-N-acetylglucosamine-1-phosphate transferase